MRISDWSSDVCSSDLVYPLCVHAASADRSPLMEKMMESGVQRHAHSGSVAAHLDYREVERVFELDTSFNSGRAEIWQLVRNSLGEMNRFMRDGVVALREVKEVSEIGGGSCRGSVCRYVVISVVD